MAFEYKQAFDLITEKGEEELKKTGFTQEKVASDNDNELVSLFTSENVAYSVHYTVDKQLMELRTCGMTADEGPDNDWKTLATWLYDDSANDQKDLAVCFQTCQTIDDMASCFFEFLCPADIVFFIKTCFEFD